VFTKRVLSIVYAKPEGRAPRACTWVDVKGEDIRSFLNNIYPALGQAKLELLEESIITVSDICNYCFFFF